MARGDPLPRQYPDHPSGIPRFSRTPIKYRRNTGPLTGTVAHQVSIQGAEVLIEHFLAAAAILEATAPEMMNVVGDLGVAEARSLVAYDTGATHDSITIRGGSSVYKNLQWEVEMGPETFYAPFLEFGTVFMQPQPFMMPAADLMEAALIASVSAILQVVTTDTQGSEVMGGGSPLANQVLGDERVRAQFTPLRSFLYSASKALGDISVIGGREVFGPLRAGMMGLARGLGDVDSVMKGAVATRISNRLSGRVTGRLVGFGSASLSFGKTYSAFPGGEGGHRIYQRLAGANLRGFSAGGGGMVSRLVP